MLDSVVRGRIICAPEFLEIKQVLRWQMEAQEAEAIQPLTRCCSPLSSFAVGRRRSSLFLTDGSGVGCLLGGRVHPLCTRLCPQRQPERAAGFRK